MNNPIILVLDPDTQNGELIQKVVHPDRFDVLVLPSEAEALRKVEEDEVALILIHGALPLAIECIETWKTEPSTQAIPLVILAAANDLKEWLGRLPERVRPEHHLLLPLAAEDLGPLLEHILGEDATWDSEPVYDAIPLDSPDEDTPEGSPAEKTPEWTENRPADTAPARPPPPPPPVSIGTRITQLSKSLLELHHRYEGLEKSTAHLRASHEEAQERWEKEHRVQTERIAELQTENAALVERTQGEKDPGDDPAPRVDEDEGDDATQDLGKWKRDATKALHIARERVHREEELRKQISHDLENARSEIESLKELQGDPASENDSTRESFRAMMKQLQSAAFMVEQAKSRIKSGRHHLKHRMDVVRELNSIWERMSTVQRSFAADASTRNAAVHLDNVLNEMRDRLRELSTIMDSADRMAEAHAKTVEDVFRVLAGNDKGE